MTTNLPTLFEPKIANIGDIEIAYKEIGKGQPLILIMGYKACMEIWPPELIKLLSEKYRLIIFDNRGMGYSSTSDEDYSINLFAEDTVNLMNYLEIDKANILGFSMGALVAMQLAIEHPERVNKLVLYSGHCGGKEAVYPNNEVIETLFDSSGNGIDRINRFFSLLFPKKWLKENRNKEDYFPIPNMYTSPECIEKQFQAMKNWKGIYDKLFNINAPALILTGSEDIITPPENSRILAKEIRKAHFIQMEGGHGLMWQYPRKFFNIIRTFI